MLSIESAAQRQRRKLWTIGHVSYLILSSMTRLLLPVTSEVPARYNK